MSRYLSEIVNKQKSGAAAGITSICTANEFAIKAAMKKAAEFDVPVLIEATANQVDQNGGYTGMKPADFTVFIKRIAAGMDFPEERIILGGDHLGPLTRSSLPEDEAMQYAEDLVREYVLAGFTKIHLDTSMRLGTDSESEPLAVEAVAQRGARLCRAAESAFAERLAAFPDSEVPVYVIGSEVPVPGGFTGEDEDSIVTSIEDCSGTYRTYSEVFKNAGLEDAFSRVLAIVVQTGVEFGDSEVFHYSRANMAALSEYGKKNLGLVFEGHSTDYQSEDSLRMMVEDGIAFLKVGPALTFALREALYSLEMIEKELYRNADEKLSNFSSVLDRVMVEAPGYWEKHYRGDEEKVRIARKYSFSDRARYYQGNPEVKASIETLINNIKKAEVPLSMLSQYMPLEFIRIMKNQKNMNAEDLILEHIGSYLEGYYKAAHSS